MFGLPGGRPRRFLGFSCSRSVSASGLTLTAGVWASSTEVWAHVGRGISGGALRGLGVGTEEESGRMRTLIGACGPRTSPTRTRAARIWTQADESKHHVSRQSAQLTSYDDIMRYSHARRQPFTTMSLAPDRLQLDKRRRGSQVVDGKLALDLATHTYDENVYLFVPNLIGQSVAPRLLVLTLSRLHTCNSCWNLTSLYGKPSKHVYTPIRSVGATRCCRRPGCTRARPDFSFWGGVGHGHGSASSIAPYYC